MNDLRKLASTAAVLVLTIGLTGTPLAAPIAGPTSSQDAHTELGTIDFPTSGSPEAQPHFIRGVLLMHSFEYDPAAEAFREAQRIDPGFAMAYWGEAMTYNHPLWFQQDRDAALAALERLAPMPDARVSKAGTEKEKGWLQAVHTLYGEGEKEARDFSYRDAMRRMYERYPDDHEVASFYALSQLGTSHGGRDFAIYMRSAAIVEQVFDENPDHPGAAHYLIHSYDDPIHAPLGLPAARAYSVIAPAAAHAQHMTSHIFVATGMWGDVVTANNVARDVQNAQRVAAGQSAIACGHYSSWLHYGLLQQGRIAEAEKEMTFCHEAMQRDPEGNAAYFATMRARDVFDTPSWDAAARWSADFEGREGARVDYDFTSGFAAVKTGHLDKARKLADSLQEKANEMDDPAVSILALELTAMLALADGNGDEAVRMLKEATQLEEDMPFQFGPPAVVKPSHELLGEVLMELERPADAAVAFEGALARAPRRTTSLMGLAHAASAMGDDERTAEIRATLHEIWAHADEGYPASSHR